MLKETIIGELDVYKNVYALESDNVDTLINFIENNSIYLGSSNPDGHVTSSAWIINKQRTRVLLTEHKKLNKWLQLGGHTEENESVYESSYREGIEESGLSMLTQVNRSIYDIDIHTIPKRNEKKEHIHYDIRYLFEANDTDEIIVSDESHDVRWIDVRDIERYTNEESVLRMVRKMKFTYKELEVKINEARTDIVDFEYTYKKINERKNDLSALTRKKAELLNILNKENSDVDKLNEISFASVLATILNNKEEKLDKEEKEALEARYNYEAICSDVELMNDEIDSLSKKLRLLKSSKDDYNEFLLIRKNMILDDNPELSVIVKKEEDALNNITANIKEIKEALSAGRTVDENVSSAKAELRTAKNWGVYDALGGKGISTLVKRNHMQKAQSHMNTLNYNLKIFSKELKDVNLDGFEVSEFSSYLSFMDYFFDGIFVDLAVLNKIDTASSKMNEISNKLSDINMKLKHNLGNFEREKHIIENNIDDLIAKKQKEIVFPDKRD